MYYVQKYKQHAKAKSTMTEAEYSCKGTKSQILLQWKGTSWLETEVQQHVSPG